MKDTLLITNLHVETTEGKKILNGVSLTIKKGETHAIMGPNGGGKSTLAQVLMGHPGYIITEGSIHINNIDITKMSTDQRAKHGLFLGFQYPVEVSGVNFSSFLRMAVNEKEAKKISPIKFRNMLQEKAEPLAFRDDISKRSLNEGFSGGEKKKAEILQMALLKPDFAVLDEPDSGLDVDALKYIANTINSLDFPLGLLLITHYQRILHYIKPQFVHILVKGKIVKSGDHLLAKEIEEKGYEEYIYE
ncbi:MAG TPA: Fe-S cluster assembly ATPase SufC [Candidatus Saccharimonadales bacterium]|nr:Fe-S cluster assembly ATPase SufC [Candidatus Saccharimonadales bacterium]